MWSLIGKLWFCIRTNLKPFVCFFIYLFFHSNSPFFFRIMLKTFFFFFSQNTDIISDYW